jgi:hypothetical protein
MVRRRRLALEQLEDRALPATFGIPWPNPGHLTISFAPDGTLVGGQQSQMFQLFNAIAPTQSWEDAILQAFQTWTAPTNINLSVVPDSGDPLGTTGPLQGDPRFGDIRITAVPLPTGIVAQATPFDPTAGSWSGDVEFNSNYLFGMGGTGQYDLLSVALHEAGHSLGIDDSSDPASAMYADFTGIKKNLTASDVAAVLGLYGARAPDEFDAASRNDTLNKGTSLNLSLGGNGLQPTVVDANLDTVSDTDVYVIKPGNNQNNLTVLIQTSGISLLLPQLTVYSPAQTVMTAAAAADPLQGDLSINLNSLQVGATYYLSVSAAVTDVFGTGSYRLQVVPAGVSPVSGVPTGSVVVLANDLHTNDSLGTATDLRQNSFRTFTPYAYAVQAAIGDSTDIDYYHILSPQGANGTTTVMRILVWGTTPDGLNPVASVFDAHGNPTDAQVLMNENGSYVLQVPDALPNMDYYVGVRGDPTAPLHATGTYVLGVNFGSQAVALQSFTSGTLTQQSADIRTLQVNQGQLFHFVLSANADQAPPSTAVTMTIFDESGNVVSTLAAFNGDSQSETLFLSPGTYTVQFTASSPDGSALSSISYSLSGVGLTDPIGVTTTNPVLSPSPPPASTNPPVGYHWVQYGTLRFSCPGKPANQGWNNLDNLADFRCPAG